MIECPGTEVILVSKVRYGSHVLLDRAILTVRVCACVSMCMQMGVSWCELVCVGIHCVSMCVRAHVCEHVHVCCVWERAET